MAALRTHLPWLFALGLLVVFGLWPLVTTGGAVGYATGDMPDHYWGTWWFGHELLDGRWPGTTDLTHFPEHLALWYVDPLGALLALPLRPLGFPAAWNGLVLLQALLGALAAYAVGFSATRSAGAATAAGAVVGVSPYFLGLTHSGLSEYMGLALPVLATWTLLRALGRDPRGRAPTTRHAVIAGLLIAACAFQAFYYAAFAALLAGCMLPGRGMRARLRPFAIVAVVAAVASAPLMAFAWDTLSTGAVGDQNAPGWNYRSLPVHDLVTFFRPGQYYFPDTRAYGNPGILHVNYLGWTALMAAGWGAWRARSEPAGARALLLPMAAYFVFALGPILTFNGSQVVVGDQPLLMPAALLYLPGSPFRLVHHPYRMVAFLLPLLSLLVAHAAARLSPGRQLALAGALLAEMAVFSPAPWPVPIAEADAPAVYADLPDGPVLDWPPDASTMNRRYEMWQVQHGHAIPYGVNVFLGETWRRDPAIVDLLAALDDVRARARNRDVAFDGELRLQATGTETRLAELGFTAIVVHRIALSPTELRKTERVMRRWFGAPTVEGDHAAWVLE